MKKLAIAYVRVSSKQQNVSRQIEELKEYASKKGYTIDKYFEDTVSGTKSIMGERKGFKKLKAYLSNEKNKTKNLFIHEVSRLGRKNFEVQNAIEEFFKIGVNIHFLDLEKSTLDEHGNKKPDSNLILSILGSMAENENRLLADRIKSGLLNSAKQGLAFSDKITGYKKGEDKRPIIDEDEAPMVRRMYELASEKTTLYFITKKIESEFGKTLGSKTISGIIKNPFYKGERKYLGETILVDKIVGKELWETANSFLSSRKNFTKRYRVNENIVEGKIACDKCDKPLYQIVNKGRSDMFKCAHGCKVSVNRPWLYEMIRYVINKHTKHLNDKEFKKDLHKKIEENQQFILELKENEEENESAQILNYEKFLKNKVKEHIYEKANTNFERELKNIEKQLKESTTKNSSYRQALKSKPQHFSFDLKTFKVQIQDILNKVEVNSEFVTININDMVNYTIPQLGGTKIGWIKKKNKGKKMIFENPFDSGIKIKNFINDEDLDVMVNNEIYDFDDDIETHFKSDEYKENMKELGSLGNKKN
jgi:DNA invertase Pin-like site-specific DNA recombinase